MLRSLAASAVAFALLAASRSHGEPRADVMTVFAEHCILCHDAEDPPDGLRFDRWQDVQDAIAHGVIVPGEPEASELIQLMLLPADSKRAMPPEDAPTRPSNAEIAVLREWIAGIAPSTPPAEDEATSPTEAAPEDAIARLQAAGAYVGLVSLDATWLRVDLGHVAFPLAEGPLDDLTAVGEWIRECSVAGASGPVPLVELVSLAPNVRTIDAARTELASLGSLKASAELVSLNLTASSVTDEMLAALRPGSRLTDLALAHTSVTGDARAAFAAAFPAVALRTAPATADGETIAWSDDQRAVWRASNALWSAVARSAWDTVAESAHEAWLGTLPGGLALPSVDAWRALEDAAETPPSVVVRHAPVRVRVLDDIAAVHSVLTRVPPVALPDAAQTTVFLTETYARTEDGWKCVTAAISNTPDLEAP
jgi:hypothetical protein